MKRQIVILLVVAAATGCATGTYWHRDNTSQLQWEQDRYECMASSQSNTSSAYVNPYGGAAQSGTSTNTPLYEACLQARGYRKGKTGRAPKN